MALSQQKRRSLKIEEKRLEQQIKLHRYLYYNKEPRISDQAFDALYERLKQVNPNNEVLKQTGAPPDKDSGWQKAQHDVFMSSLNNAMNEKEFQQKFITLFGTNGKIYVVEDKFDGSTIDLKYEDGILVQAITRGDGRTGEDILINALKMKFVKRELLEKIDATIRGEIILLKSDFDKVQQLSDKPFANPRNAANGIAKRFDGKFSDYLSVVVYDISSPDKSFSFETEKMDYLNKELQLVTANYKLLTAAGVIDLRKQYTEKIRDTLPYMIDGLVVKVNNLQVQKAAGLYPNNDPKGQIAFKFDPRGVATTLKAITNEVGRTGVITPLAVLEPVNIDGTMVKSASLHNYDEIERLGVGIGDTVIVIKSGEIIPKLTNVIEKAYICPECKFIGTIDEQKKHHEK